LKSMKKLELKILKKNIKNKKGDLERPPF